MPSQAERRASKKEKNQPPEEISKIEDETTPIVVVGIIAAVAIALGVFAFISTFFSTIFARVDIVQLDVHNHALIKQVLFGGEPWLVYCVNNETAHYPVAPVLTDKGGAAELYSKLGVKTGVLNCFEEMPSGKTIAQKFTWGTEPAPFGFAIANGDAPIKVNIMATKSPEELIKKVEPVLSIKMSTVDSLQKWTTLCTGRRTCVVLAHKSAAAKEGAKNIFTPLLQKHRQVKVVNLDVAFWALRLGQNLTDTRPQLKIAKPNDLDVVCLARADGVKAKKEVHFGSYLQNLESADNFLSDCAGQKNLLSLGVEPKIGAKQTRNEKSEVIEAEPLPKDFFKDEQKKPTADGKRDAVGSRGNLHQEKIVEDVDESEQTSEEQSDQSEEDEGEEVEL